MKVSTKIITPAIAKTMLEKNGGNRPLNKRHVKSLVREMTLGRWKTNGDTICINGDKLIDGQHRLHAVVESGITITTLVVEGLPSDVFDTKDVGKRRSPADTLAVKGETNCCKLAAVLTAVDRYMTGRVEQDSRYSNADIEALLDKYPGVRSSLTVSNKKQKLISSTTLAACHFLFSQKDAKAADSFVDRLLHGKNLDEADAVYLLRERLVQNTMAKAKLPPVYVFALAIKCWNACRSGTRLKFLRYSEGETFPLIA